MVPYCEIHDKFDLRSLSEVFSYTNIVILTLLQLYAIETASVVEIMMPVTALVS